MKEGTDADLGFTLIELMIVVAIIGILAAIAIPNFNNMLLRARRAELPSNLDGIRTAEKAYEAEWAFFTACSMLPTALPGRVSVTFPANLSSNFDWNLLGWVPDGKVRGQYGVTVDNSGVRPLFTSTGNTDVDGDAVPATGQATQDLKPFLTTSNNVY